MDATIATGYPSGVIISLSSYHPTCLNKLISVTLSPWIHPHYSPLIDVTLPVLKVMTRLSDSRNTFENAFLRLQVSSFL